MRYINIRLLLLLLHRVYEENTRKLVIMTLDTDTDIVVNYLSIQPAITTEN